MPNIGMPNVSLCFFIYLKDHTPTSKHVSVPQGKITSFWSNVARQLSQCHYII